MESITYTVAIDKKTRKAALNKSGKGPLHNGDTLTIKAPAYSSILVMFPPCRDPLLIGTTEIEAGKSLEVAVYAPRGVYPFAIYINATNQMMTKDQSGPEMEVG